MRGRRPILLPFALLAFAFAAKAQPAEPMPASAWNAFKDLQHRAEAGDAGAMVEMGDRRRLGQGLPKDCGEALLWYRRAEAAGDARGLTKAGYLYAHGLGVEKDLSKAFDCY